MQINIAKIRGLMAEHGDTQADLAAKLGVTRATVSNYLCGKTAISLETANVIAGIYTVDPISLIMREG